jgi:hypothetical protein
VNHEDISQSTHDLLQACLAHLDNVIVNDPDPQDVARARELKAEVLRLQIRLGHQRRQGQALDDQQAQALEQVLPALMAALPPRA